MLSPKIIPAQRTVAAHVDSSSAALQIAPDLQDTVKDRSLADVTTDLDGSLQRTEHGSEITEQGSESMFSPGEQGTTVRGNMSKTSFQKAVLTFFSSHLWDQF